MEWILAALVACAVVQVTAGGMTCETRNYAKLTTFSGQVEDMLFPCKYMALRGQKCGKYSISLTPGMKWIHKDYRLDTLWLELTDNEDTSRQWEGRTDNKLAVKFINAGGKGRALFQQKSKGTKTEELFISDIDDDGNAYIEEKDSGAFRVTFGPWYPRSKEYLTHVKNSYTQASFKFYCKTDETEMQPYPVQMCGNGTKNVVEDLGKAAFAGNGTSKELRHRMIIYEDLFLNEDITQTDERCQLASSILREQCEGRSVRGVLSQCEAIISGSGLTECVNRYSCHPMDVFNACLRWGCTGEKAFDKNNKEDCEKTAEGIDLCMDVTSVLGNLTGYVRSANCYKDYLTLNK